MGVYSFWRDSPLQSKPTLMASKISNIQLRESTGERRRILPEQTMWPRTRNHSDGTAFFWPILLSNSEAKYEMLIWCCFTNAPVWLMIFLPHKARAINLFIRSWLPDSIYVFIPDCQYILYMYNCVQLVKFLRTKHFSCISPSMNPLSWFRRILTSS